MEHEQFDTIVKELVGSPLKLQLDDNEGDFFSSSTDLSKVKSKETDLIDNDLIDDDVDDVVDLDNDDDNLDDKQIDKKDTTKVVEKTSTTKDDDVDDDTDLGNYESDIAKFVSERLTDKLGTDLGEVENIEDIVDKLAEIVEANSVPEFANEEIEKLDKFVREGGDLKRYYAEMYENTLDVDTVDIEDTSDQKRIIKQNLKNSGYTDTQIKRKLERFEETGMLQEEAEEALDLIKEFNKKKEQKLLREQENVKGEQQKQQQKFISDVQSTLKDITEIGGIPISSEQKKELLKYMLVFNKDGKTGYQDEYNKNIAKNFIISAFFQKYHNILLEKVEKKGASSLTKELQQKLAQKGKRIKKSTTHNEGSDLDAFELFSRKLRRSN